LLRGCCTVRYRASQVLLRRFNWEKHHCYQLGLFLYLPITVGFYFLPREPVWVVYLGGVGAGVGTATVFLLPALMLPDCVDEGGERSIGNPCSPAQPSPAQPSCWLTGLA